METLDTDRVFVTEKGSYFFSSESNSLRSFTDLKGNTFNFSQDYFYYIAHRGNNSEFEFRASGAYIFRPENQDPIQLNKADSVQIQEGPHYIQLEMEFETFASQLLRIPKSQNAKADLEIEWLIGMLIFLSLFYF